MMTFGASAECAPRIARFLVQRYWWRVTQPGRAPGPRMARRPSFLRLALDAWEGEGGSVA
jgi:hypothetical protein